MKRWEVVLGDALEVLAALEPESVDSVVCDPPYGIGFMGREWDDAARMASTPPSATPDTPLGRFNTGKGQGAVAFEGRAFQSWCERWARLALRALKPGGYLLAFGGTRTYHRMAAGVEDAGFEVRDQLQWLYGQGFPKSLDVGKAIDAAAGAEREVLRARSYELRNDGGYSGGLNTTKPRSASAEVSAPATPDAERWQGWGTALKPAHEPVVLARKPLAGSVAGNVLMHGTGTLNVDGCRIGTEERTNGAGSLGANGIYGRMERNDSETIAAGRWPANVLMDPAAAALLDEQAPDTGGGGFPGALGGIGQGAVYGKPGSGEGLRATGRVDANGGASRFYYCAKASTAERNALDLAYLPRARSARKRHHQDLAGSWRDRARNRHPTVKPVELMRWLVRLVTPPGGLVVDPFAGSGTTGCAAILERCRFLGIEREHGSAIIARARIAWWSEHPDGVELVQRIEAEALRAEVAAAGQEALF